MDMKINFLPAKTWNWLRMNETEVKQVKADRQALEKEEIPGNVCGREQAHWNRIQNRYGTGHGQAGRAVRLCSKSLPDACRHEEGGLRCALALSVRIKTGKSGSDRSDCRRKQRDDRCDGLCIRCRCRGTLQRENPRKGRKRRTAASRSDRLPRQRVPCFK